MRVLRHVADIASGGPGGTHAICGGLPGPTYGPTYRTHNPLAALTCVAVLGRTMLQVESTACL